MAEMDTSRLNWLLRELELTAVVAMRRAAPQANQYLWLRAALFNTDVRSDAEFQQRLARYIGLRGKLRLQREALFDLFERFKTVEQPSFEDILREVSALTGQVEKSVASALLSLLQPDQPTIDRDLRELLPRYGFTPLAEAPVLEDCVAWHESLAELFTQVIASPKWAEISAQLDAQLPEATGFALTEVRKLNLHLTHARRIVALIPLPRLAGTVQKGADEALDPSQPRLAVRLHLCR